MLRRFCKSNLTQLILFLVVFGAISVYFRFEVLWDWANYHFYNPWAFLNERWNYDIAPAGINTFFNPLIDIPLYLMVDGWNDYPDLIMFIQGFWAGAVAFVFYKIIRLFFSENKWKDHSLSVLVLAFGITSWPFFSQIGTCTNEMSISLLVMISWWLILNEIKKSSTMVLRGRVFLLAGFLLGAAAGLKLTAVTYCVASGATLILCYRFLRPFPKLLGLFVLGGLIGFLLTNGFWMWRLYKSFGNPFFPLFNNIFKSEYYDLTSFRDESYLPPDFLGYIFYPFYILFSKFKTESEFFIIDYRNILLYSLFIGWLIYSLIRRHKKDYKQKQISRLMTILCFLSGCSYVTWLLLFSISRYYIPVSLICGIIFVKAGVALYPKRGIMRQSVFLSLIIIVSYILLTTPYYSSHWDQRLEKSQNFSMYENMYLELKEDNEYREKYGEFTKFVEMEDIKLPEGTLLQMYEMPVGGILPLLNQSTNVRGILMDTNGFNHEGKVFRQGKWMEKKKEIFKEKYTPQALLFSFNIKYMRYYHNYAKQEGLECHKLINNMMNWVLCVPKDKVKSVFRWRYQ